MRRSWYNILQCAYRRTHAWHICLFVLKRAVIVCLHEYLINFGYICVWVADVCAIVDMLLWEVILKSINCYGGNKRAGGNIRIQLL